MAPNEVKWASTYSLLDKWTHIKASKTGKWAQSSSPLAGWTYLKAPRTVNCAKSSSPLAGWTHLKAASYRLHLPSWPGQEVSD